MGKNSFWEVFLAVLIALIFFNSFREAQSRLVTVSVTRSDTLNGPGVLVEFPIVRFYTGGSDYQVFVFSRHKESQQFYINHIMTSGTIMGGDIAEVEYLLVCAPKQMNPVDALEYYWNHHHSTGDSSWTGFDDLPGRFELFCE